MDSVCLNNYVCGTSYMQGIMGKEKMNKALALAALSSQYKKNICM